MHQNPRLKTIGVALMLVGGVLAWMVVPGLSSLLIIAGLLLANTGVDTDLTDDGIKLGFTRLRAADLQDVYEGDNGEIVLVARNRRRFRIRKWHYDASDWIAIREHIRKLTRTKPNKPQHPTA